MNLKMLLRLAALSLITGTLGLSGCKSHPSPSTPASPVSSDGNPSSPQNSGGTASNSSGAPAQPTPPPASQPVSAAPSNEAAASAPVAAPAAPPVAPPLPPPPPPPVVITAPAGTPVRVAITETLRASKNDVGDRFTGVLSRPLIIKGRVLFPKGTRVAGTVIASKGRGRFKGAGALGIELNSIGGVRISSSEYEQVEKGKGKRTAGLIGGGGGGGALIGGLAGGGKGALIGGLIGAGAGTAGAAFTGNKDVIIPSETIVVFTLTAPVSQTLPAPTTAPAPASN